MPVLSRFHKAVSVEARPDFVLDVRFSGGEEKRYDMQPVFAAWPRFEELRESPAWFGKVAVGPGGYGVVWGDEWDVGADELFANGVACRVGFSATKNTQAAKRGEGERRANGIVHTRVHNSGAGSLIVSGAIQSRVQSRWPAGERGSES